MKKSKKTFRDLPESDLEKAAGGGITFGISWGWSRGCSRRAVAVVPATVTVSGTRARAPGLHGGGARDGRCIVPVGSGAAAAPAPAAGGVVVASAPMNKLPV